MLDLAAQALISLLPPKTLQAVFVRAVLFRVALALVLAPIIRMWNPPKTPSKRIVVARLSLTAIHRVGGAIQWLIGTLAIRQALGNSSPPIRLPLLAAIALPIPPFRTLALETPKETLDITLLLSAPITPFALQALAPTPIKKEIGLSVLATTARQLGSF